MSSFVTQPHKRGIVVTLLKNEKYFVTMDVTFCENEPYLSQDSLQGENNVGKENFWELSLLSPLPEQLLNQPSVP